MVPKSPRIAQIRHQVLLFSSLPKFCYKFGRYALCRCPFPSCIHLGLISVCANLCMVDTALAHNVYPTWRSAHLSLGRPAALRTHAIIALWPRNLAASRPRSLAASQPRSLAASQPRSLAALRPRSLAASSRPSRTAASHPCGLAATLVYRQPRSPADSLTSIKHRSGANVMTISSIGSATTRESWRGQTWEFSSVASAKRHWM